MEKVSCSGKFYFLTKESGFMLTCTNLIVHYYVEKHCILFDAQSGYPSFSLTFYVVFYLRFLIKI